MQLKHSYWKKVSLNYLLAISGDCEIGTRYKWKICKTSKLVLIITKSSENNLHKHNKCRKTAHHLSFNCIIFTTFIICFYQFFLSFTFITCLFYFTSWYCSFDATLQPIFLDLRRGDKIAGRTPPQFRHGSEEERALQTPWIRCNTSDRYTVLSGP